MINGQIHAGKWDEFKGEVQKLWGDLTSDELEKTNGDVQAIFGLVQQRHGLLQEDNKYKLTSLIERYGAEASEEPQHH